MTKTIEHARYNPLRWTFSQKCAAAGAISAVATTVWLMFPAILEQLNLSGEMKHVHVEIADSKADTDTKIDAMKVDLDKIPAIEQHLSDMDEQMKILCGGRVSRGTPSLPSATYPTLSPLGNLSRVAAMRAPAPLN